MNALKVTIQSLTHRGFVELPFLFTNFIDLNTSIASFQNDIYLEFTVIAERKHFSFNGRTELLFTESNSMSINKAKFDVPMAFSPNLILSVSKE